MDLAENRCSCRRHWGRHAVGRDRKVYYDPTIKDIIMADCARCHSGLTRNLTDFDSLKMYADSGMLAAMVSGTMRRFAGNDAQTIIDWVDQGTPEKPGGAAANFMTGLRGPRAGGQGQPPAVSHQAAPGGEQVRMRTPLSQSWRRTASGAIPARSGIWRPMKM